MKPTRSHTHPYVMPMNSHLHYKYTCTGKKKWYIILSIFFVDFSGGWFLDGTRYLYLYTRHQNPILILLVQVPVVNRGTLASTGQVLVRKYLYLYSSTRFMYLYLFKQKMFGRLLRLTLQQTIIIIDKIIFEFLQSSIVGSNHMVHD
jgi:hypothetical protein